MGTMMNMDVPFFFFFEKKKILFPAVFFFIPSIEYVDTEMFNGFLIVS